MFIIFKRYEVFIVGVTIALLTGDNGIINKSGDAKRITEISNEKEELEVAVIRFSDKRGNLDATKIVNGLQKEIKNLKEVSNTDGKFPVKVEYKNGHKYQITKDGDIMITLNAGERAPDDSNAIYSSDNFTAVIPAGFTVSNVAGESSIKTGLVIKDDAKNEFVWIPVNIPWKSDSTKTITLSRYTFASNGKPTDRGSNLIINCLESESSEYGNAVAKNINDFISKTNAVGGFWIGRYEARIEGYTSVDTNCPYNNPNWVGYTGGKLVEKPEAQVFNYITQNKASELSRTMYSNNRYFESDLINSYAWDTAALFLQEYDNREGTNLTPYSVQSSINTGSVLEKGTVLETNKDKICNVYDIASNCFEWSTETTTNSNYPCVKRGGQCYVSSNATKLRSSVSTTYALDSDSFRPILYIK